MSKDKRAKALSVIRYADDFVIIHIKEKSKGGNNSDKNLVLIHLPQCLRHLQKAFANFWSKQAKYPRFKKKCNGGSAEFTLSAFKYQEGKLWLAKCKEPLNIVWSRYLPEGCNPSTVTIKLGPSGRRMSSNRFFVTLNIFGFKLTQQVGSLANYTVCTFSNDNIFARIETIAVGQSIYLTCS